MDQLDEQLNGHQHGHGCGFCAGEPEEIIKQQRREEGVERFDAWVKANVHKTTEALGSIKKALSPLAPENLAAVVERIDSKVSEVLVLAHKRAEEQNANRQSLWASLGVKEKRALAGAAIIAAQMGVQTSAAVASESVAIPHETPSHDLEAYRTIAHNIGQTPGIASRIDEIRYSDGGVLLIKDTPVAQDSNPSNTERLTTSSSQLEQASINHRLDLTKTTEKTREILTKTLNLKVNEAGDEAQLERPLVRELQEGENPVSLAKAILGPEKSKDKSTLYALTWLIVDLNDIDVEAGEDKLILAGTSLKLPLETADSERYTVQPGDTVSAIEKKFGIEDRQGFLQNNAIIDVDYIEAGWELVIDSDKQPTAVDVVEVAEESSVVETVDEEEVEAVSAEAALDQIITAVESIENPEPAFVEVFDVDVEPLPTPITDSLKENRDEILNDIAEGKTDVGSVQSRAIVDLSLVHSELTPDVVARQFVSQAFEQAGLSPPTSEQIESLSVEVLKGINDDNPVLDVLAQTEGIHMDTKSKLVVDIVKELEAEVATRTKEVATRTEEVEEARQKLQTFGLEIDASFNYESVATIMAEESLRGELRGDAYYYLLLDGNTTQDNVEFVRQDLAQGLFNSYRAEKLLDLNDVQLEIIDATVETLSQDYINLGQYIAGVEQILLERLETGKATAVPAIAEMAVLFDEVDEIDDEVLSRLVVEAATGASTDFIKMSVLEEIASLREVTLSEIVASYYQKTFEASGLGEALNNRIQELSEETLTVWVDDGFSKNSVRLDAIEVVNSVVEEALGQFIEDNEKYIGAASDGVQLSDELNSLIISYLNTSGDRESFDILFIKTLASNPDKATSEYLTDYYTIRGAGNYLEPGVIEAIGHAVAEDATKPSDYTETLKTYSGNPEDLFPGGMQYVLRDYDGKDLAPFFEAAGLDIQSVLANPLNENLVLEDGVLVAKDMPTIWFDDRGSVDKARLKKAYDEVILGIKPPEVVRPPTEVSISEEQGVETNFEAQLEKLIEQGPILESVEAFAKYSWDKDGDGTLDNPLLNEIWNNWSRSQIAQALLRVGGQGWIDYDKGVEAVLRDVAENEGISYRFGNDGDDFDKNEAIEMNRNLLRVIMISSFLLPKEKFYVMNLTDGGHINRSNHFTDKRGEKPQYGLGNAVDFGNASQTGWLNFIGDGLVLNQDTIGGFRELILGHPDFKNQINHGSRYTPNARVAAGHSGNNLHGHLSFLSVITDDPQQTDSEVIAEADRTTSDQAEKENVAAEDAKREEEKKVAEEKATIDAKTEEARIAEQRDKEEQAQQQASNESKPEGIEQEQLIVAQASTVEELVALGFPTLGKIPEADQKAFNDVLAEMPTIEEAIENFNSLDGDPRGPRLPATAVIAIAYDLGMKGEDLINSVTTARGESIGFAPYIIGDDKGERTEDGKVVQLSSGIGQFYQRNENGLTDEQLARAEVLLNPVVALMEMVDYKQRRGLTPWNVWNNRAEQLENWNAHRARVMSALAILGDDVISLLP